MSEADRRREQQHDGATPTEPTPIGSRPSGGGVSSARFFTPGDAAEPMPERIGPYRLIRELGRGGMGSVYLAVSGEDRLRRQVALKVIRRGMDTDEILRRFQLERQVLSALTHPNIARLLDCGAVEDGRPYFVLEYIEGQTIDAFCDANGLNVAERLRLFQKVCAAVHYAHQNLVVHRDLKPHNILVTTDGEPKLLDFGIAKLINAQMMQVTVATGPQLRLMTPEYASPEQVRGSPVSTVSDVYSLGVLLYEILTGHRPYRFESRVEQEIVRIVCEVDPERPSAAVSRIEEVSDHDGTKHRLTPETVSRVREGDPLRLRRRLSGDLDDIVLKAMEKAPPKRYLSAQQLGEDIQRHLDGMPVAARARRGAFYLAQKFVRRNRPLVGAAAAVFLALSAGLGLATWQWREANVAKLRAQEAAAAAREVVDSFSTSVDAFDAIDAQRTAESGDERGDALASTIAEIQRLHGVVGAQPDEVRDSLRRGLVSAAMLIGDRAGGRRGPNLGRPAEALLAYEAVQAMLQSVTGESPEALRQEISANMRLGDALRSDNARLPEALEHYLRAEAAAIKLSSLSTGRESSRRAAIALLGVASVMMTDGQYEPALQTIERSLNIRQGIAQVEPSARAQRDLSVAYFDMGECLQRLGRGDEAVAAFERCVELRRGLVEAERTARTERDLAVALVHGLAGALQARGDANGAYAHLVEGSEAFERLADAAPTDSRGAMDVIDAQLLGGRLMRDLRRPDEARQFCVDASARIDGARKQWPDLATIRRQYSAALLLRGEVEALADQLVEAESWLGRAVTEYRTLALDGGPADERNLAHALWRQGTFLQSIADNAPGENRQRRWESASSAARESLSRYENLVRAGRLPETTPAIAQLRTLIASCDEALGQ